jgi:hypothetical protein
VPDKISTLTKEQLYGFSSDFTLFPGGVYFVEHHLANLVWDPEENTVSVFKGTYLDFCDKQKTPCGRFDSAYFIEGKIGKDFKLITK